MLLERGIKHSFMAMERPCSSLNLGAASWQSEPPNLTWIFPTCARLWHTVACRAHIRLGWHSSHHAPAAGMGISRLLWIPGEIMTFGPLVLKDGQGYLSTLNL